MFCPKCGESRYYDGKTCYPCSKKVINNYKIPVKNQRFVLEEQTKKIPKGAIFKVGQISFANSPRHRDSITLWFTCEDNKETVLYGKSARLYLTIEEFNKLVFKEHEE